MENSEGFAAGPARGATASEDVDHCSAGLAQLPVDPDWIRLAVWPSDRDLVDEVLQIHRGLVGIRTCAAAAGNHRIERAACKLELDALQFLAAVRMRTAQPAGAA